MKKWLVILAALVMALCVCCACLAEGTGDEDDLTKLKLSVTAKAAAMNGTALSATFQLEMNTGDGRWIADGVSAQLAETAPSGFTVGDDGSVTAVLTGLTENTMQKSTGTLSLYSKANGGQGNACSYRWTPVSVTANGITAEYSTADWTEQDGSRSHQGLTIVDGNSKASLADGTTAVFDTVITGNSCVLTLTGSLTLKVTHAVQDNDGNYIQQDEDAMEAVYTEVEPYRNGSSFGAGYIFLNYGDLAADGLLMKEVRLPRYDENGAEYTYTLEKLRYFDPKNLLTNPVTDVSYSLSAAENSGLSEPVRTAALYTHPKDQVERMTFNVKLEWQDGGNTSSRKPAQFTLYRIFSIDDKKLDAPEACGTVTLTEANNWQQSIRVEVVYTDNYEYSSNVNHYVLVETGLKLSDTEIVPLHNLENMNSPLGSVEYLQQIMNAARAQDYYAIGAIGSSDGSPDGLSYQYTVRASSAGISLNKINYTFRNVRTVMGVMDYTVKKPADIKSVKLHLHLLQKKEGTDDPAVVDKVTFSYADSVLSGTSSAFGHTSSAGENGGKVIRITGLPMFDKEGKPYAYELRPVSLLSQDDTAYAADDNGVYIVGEDLLQIVRGQSSVSYQGQSAHYAATWKDSCEIVSGYAIMNGTKLRIFMNVVMQDLSGCGPWGTGITDVSFSDNVTIIGANAFTGCTKLETVTIPGSVTSIGARAFAGCTKLEAVTIPASVTSIGKDAFPAGTVITLEGGFSQLVAVSSGLKQNTNIVVTGTCGESLSYSFDSVSSVLTISGSGAMDDYKASGDTAAPWAVAAGRITGIVLPDGVTGIGNYAFYQCTKLTGITLPDSLATIGEYALNHTGLNSVTVPGSVTTIGNAAIGFNETATVPGFVITAPFRSAAMAYANKNTITFRTDAEVEVSEQKTLTLPASLETLNDYAFMNTAAECIIIPAGCTTIDTNAFADTNPNLKVIINHSNKTVNVPEHVYLINDPVTK